MSNNTNNLHLVIIYSLLPAVYGWLKVLNGQEKENLQSLNYDVSDKGNGVGVNKGKWFVRHPIWRSERASALMEQLQQQINDSQREDLAPWVSRVKGVPSEKQMSRHNVAWALADIERATGGEHSRRRWRRMRGAATAQPQNSIQHQSLFCIHGEVIKASLEGNIDTHHALLGYRGVSSKVTLNS